MKSLKKKLVLVLFAVLLVLLNIGILLHGGDRTDTVALNMTIEGSVKGDIQTFYGSSESLSADHSQVLPLAKKKQTTLTFYQPSDTTFARVDFGIARGTYTITDLFYEYRGKTQAVDLSLFLKDRAVKTHDIVKTELKGGQLKLSVKADDPYIVVQAGPTDLAQAAADHQALINRIRNIIYAVLIDLIAVALFLRRKRFASLPIELYQNRKMIFRMAKNDFNTKYAGSVLGTVWAFVQPCVTVLVYWFVFGHLGSGDVVSRLGISYPFVLWLIAGLVPWFFFQDTMVGGTNALLEYSYLVKKVVFKISVLPIVKEISAVFVHIFFIALMFVLYLLAGHRPDSYWLQVFYYSFALFIYALGVCYAFCSIVVFFRDLSQVISIIIQVQVWMTPIMWNVSQFGSRLPGWAMTLLKLNPMYYIAMGYRDAMIEKVWFWQRFDLTVYFWLITAVFFGIGTFIFKRLKPHFADIL